MRSSFTCCPHSKPLNYGTARTLPDEKLAFVEHILDVLIESRYGPGRHYTTIADRDRADFTYLPTDKLEARMRHIGEDPMPFYRTISLGRRQDRQHQQVVVCGEELTIINGINAGQKTLGRARPAPQLPVHTGVFPLARGSPTFLGRTTG